MTNKMVIWGGLLGWAVRFIGGAIAFGYWQQSIAAGFFALAFLVTVNANHD